MDAKAFRMATNVLVIRMLAAMAVSLFRTLANIKMPCSVKAVIGTAECFMDLNRSQFATSSPISGLESGNMKLAGNLPAFRLTCSFSRFVSTPYNTAKSRSSMTCTPRIVKMRDRMPSSSGRAPGSVAGTEATGNPASSAGMGAGVLEGAAERCVSGNGADMAFMDVRATKSATAGQTALHRRKAVHHGGFAGKIASTLRLLGSGVRSFRHFPLFSLCSPQDARVLTLFTLRFLLPRGTPRPSPHRYAARCRIPEIL